MKILWLVNIILPSIAEQIGGEVPIGGGWLVQTAAGISEHADLIVVFPQSIQKECLVGKTSALRYYGFFESGRHLEKYHKELEETFSEILQKETPDLVHIWGTEYTYSYAMAKSYHCRERTIISIQGIISRCASAYMADIPNSVSRGWTFRDIVRFDNLKSQQHKFAKRGVYEEMTLRLAGNLVGRTEWDQAIGLRFNSSAKYYKCNEILRTSFYEKKGQWTEENCERYSLFLSQGGYPLKGLHKVIEAVAQLKSSYPALKLYIAGSNKKKFHGATFWEKLRQSSYDRYIEKLVKKYSLEDSIVALGNLTEGEMAERLLKTNIFISAASMENESNSLSEAKLIGVPCVVSYAGGTTSRIEHGVDGFHYQYEESYMLAFYLKQIFEDPELASRVSRNAMRRAAVVNDREMNIACLDIIYLDILENKSEKEHGEK